MSWSRGNNGSGTGGKSAYQIWLDNGNVGTEQDFLNSMSAINDNTISSTKKWSSSKIKTYVDTNIIGGSGGGSTSSLIGFPYYVPNEDGCLTPSNRVFREWTVEEFYQAYDSLMTQYPQYIKRDIAPYKDMSETFELRRYIFEPEWGYEKTIHVQAGAHGSEYAGKCSLLRICQILCEDWESNPYLTYIRNNVRLIVIPIVNPWGHWKNTLLNSNGSANTSSTKGVNLNRNYEARWALIMSAGSDHSGATIFSENETKWVRETIMQIGVENIHYAFDFHDAPTQSLFGDYWINFNTHHETSKKTFKRLQWQLGEKNFGSDTYIWHDRDTATTGTFAGWCNKTLGFPASTVEHCYEGMTTPFDVPFMNRAVEVYFNAVILASIINHESPVNRSDKMWFDLNWWKGTWDHIFYKGESFNAIIEKWDELCTKYSNYAKKSDTFVTSYYGEQIHHYIFSPKKYKKTILIVGGRMEPNRNHIRWSRAMLRVAEYLCMYGDKDKHTSNLINNVRIIMIPFLEYGVQYLNSYGNFAVDGTPNTTKIPVANIISIMDTIGVIDGVIYSRELNDTDVLSATTNDVFVLPSQDTNDIANIQNYASYLSTKKGLSTDVNWSATAEFGNYVFNVRNIPCVRVDTGLDHKKHTVHSSDFADAYGSFTLSMEVYMKLNHEVARRMNNMINIVKTMCDI